MAVTPVSGQYVFGEQLASATVTTSTFSTLPTPGNVILLFCIWNNAGGSFTSVVDSKGNTYTQISTVQSGANSSAAIFAAPVTNPTAGATDAITVTWTGSVDFPTIIATEFTGITSSGYGISFEDTSSASPATVNVTPATTGDLIIAAGPYPDNGDSTGVSAGCTQIGTFTPDNDSGLSYRIAASTSATAVGFTMGSTGNIVVIAAGFPASGGTAAPLDPIGFGAEA